MPIAPWLPGSRHALDDLPWSHFGEPPDLAAIRGPQIPNGHGPVKSRLAPSEHPNPTTKIPTKRVNSPTPKWDPMGIDPRPSGKSG